MTFLLDGEVIDELPTTRTETGSVQTQWDSSGQVAGERRFQARASVGVNQVCRSSSSVALLQVLAVPPTVTGQPEDLILPVGESGRFTVQATGSGPFSYQWQRSDDGGVSFEDIGGAVGGSLDVDAVSVLDDGALFRVSVSNSEGEATSEAARLTVTNGATANSCPDIVVPPLNSLNLKEGPRPGAAPPVPDDPPAWAGTNHLADPGFENEWVYAGGVPTGTGYWAFDQAWSAPAGQQGIVAHEGGRMLHFVSSSAFGQAPAATASEQIQLVDVSALRDRIDAGEIEVEGSAFFNRVAAGGCVNIDSGFAIRITAYDGLPQDFPARIGSPPLAPAAVGGVTADDDPLTWQQGSAVLPLPAGTTYIAVQIDINERVNDMAYPEFHGHYADDVRLEVRLRP